MATDGLRRSTRVRKQVKTYDEGQAEESQLPAALAAPSKKRKRADATIKVELVEDSEDDLRMGTPFDEDNFTGDPKIEISSNAEDDSDEGETSKEESVEETKPEKRSKKSQTKQTGQRYGTPALGTLIPGVRGRVWKQPQVWEVKFKYDSNDVKGDDWHVEAAKNRIARANAALHPLAYGRPEVRAKSYITTPPDWYDKFLERASTQKMFVLERSRGVEEDCHALHHDCPFETLQIAGSKGAVYHVTISHLTSCTCPVTVFSKKGQEKQCKHVLYVLHHILKAPDHLKYQAAFLTSELKELFESAPPLPTEVVEDASMDGHRKPADGDCPICFMEFEEEEELVWCRAACGNNLHKTCFKKWAQAKDPVTCPFCRTEWQNETKRAQSTTVTKLTEPAARSHGGYRNVFDQLEYGEG